VGRIGIQFLDTAADLEEVQEFSRKVLRGNLRRKRAVIIRPVFQQATRGVTAREAVAQVKIEEGRRLEA
jgi:hypothetical protein